MATRKTEQNIPAWIQHAKLQWGPNWKHVYLKLFPPRRKNDG